MFCFGLMLRQRKKLSFDDDINFIPFSWESTGCSSLSQCRTRLARIGIFEVSVYIKLSDNFGQLSELFKGYIILYSLTIKIHRLLHEKCHVQHYREMWQQGALWYGTSLKIVFQVINFSRNYPYAKEEIFLLCCVDFYPFFILVITIGKAIQYML